MLDFQRYIDKFLSYLEIEKNYSSYTLINYKRDLLDFAPFVDRQIEKVDYFLFRKFLARLNAKGVKKKTVSRKISTLKSFFKFLLKFCKRRRNRGGSGKEGCRIAKTLTTRTIIIKRIRGCDAPEPYFNSLRPSGPVPLFFILTDCGAYPSQERW